MRSGAALPSDAIDRDRHRLESEPKQTLDGGRDRQSDVATHGDERLARPGDNPDPDADVARGDARHDGRTGEPRPPAWAAARHPGDAGNLVGGKTDDVVDDSPPDGQLRAGHGCGSATAALAPAAAPPAPAPAASGRSASAMSSGTRVRAI